MNEQEVEKPTMPFLNALILADALGPQYRVCLSNGSADCPAHRHRWVGDYSFMADGGANASIGAPDADAVIIRPAKREVSFPEALLWASQGAGRVFRGEVGGKYRVSQNYLQRWNTLADSWCNIQIGNWDEPCIIDEGWEDVTTQVRVVVE